jgi:hypothetical protein
MAAQVQQARYPSEGVSLTQSWNKSSEGLIKNAA